MIFTGKPTTKHVGFLFVNERIVWGFAKEGNTPLLRRGVSRSFMGKYLISNALLSD